MSDNNMPEKKGKLWEELWARLKVSQEYFERGMHRSTQEKYEILKKRAKQLATEQKKSENEDASLTVVEFMLAYERYAFELSHVREVYPLKDLTPLPGTQSFVQGIINIRSQIISLIDLKLFFELPAEGLTNLNRVIILHSDQMEFGVLADEILGVRSIPIHRIQATLPTLTGIGADYLKGVTQDRLIILDADKILADPKVVVHEEVD